MTESIPYLTVNIGEIPTGESFAEAIMFISRVEADDGDTRCYVLYYKDLAAFNDGKQPVHSQVLNLPTNPQLKSVLYQQILATPGSPPLV